jgi:hypothetical protein
MLCAILFFFARAADVLLDFTQTFPVGGRALLISETGERLQVELATSRPPLPPAAKFMKPDPKHRLFSFEQRSARR